MKKKKYSLHPSTYFIVAAILIGYFFPREGKFRYQFYEGKPWRYGLLTAPSDFPIYKTEAEVKAERDSALKLFEPYFRMNDSIVTFEINKLRNDYQTTLKNRATPAHMQYIENSLQNLYQKGILSTQEMDELKDKFGDEWRLRLAEAWFEICVNEWMIDSGDPLSWEQGVKVICDKTGYVPD